MASKGHTNESVRGRRALFKRTTGRKTIITAFDGTETGSCRGEHFWGEICIISLKMPCSSREDVENVAIGAIRWRKGVHSIPR